MSEDPDWEPFWTYLELIGVIVVETRPPPPSSVKGTEAGNLEFADTIAASFAEAGLRSGSSEEDRLRGLEAIDSASAAIVSNPDVFLDPGWSDFLGTLEEIEVALIVAGAGV